MILLLLLGSFRSDLAASASKRGAILEGWSEAARDQSWQAQNELLAPRADLKRATPPPSDSQSSRDVDSVSWEDRTSSTPQPDSTAKADERDPSAEIGYEEHLGSEFGLNFRGAGLLLVIPALARTGYPEWLAARPSLQEQDAARLFLLSLFAHYSPQSLSSATRLLMGTRRSLQGPPHPELHQACLVWRKGIDGWLRRNAKCRLHDLGSIDGWLHEGVERHHLAFPLSAIHMGLRRKALDVDPGWVPWLGLCLGYLFAEHPETLGGEA